MARAAQTKKTESNSTAVAVNAPARLPGPPKLKVGRPSTYNPDLCDKVMELGADGQSQVQIAVALGVPRSTMQSWAEQYPEFSAALTRAKELEQAWYELAGRQGMYDPSFNAAVWKTSVQARFRQDYTERKEQIVQGGEQPILVAQHKRIDVRLLEPEQREALKQLLITARESAVQEDGD